MRFLLRPDFPNTYVTDDAGRDLYWVRSGMADQVGLWSLRDLTGRELVQVAQHGPRLAPSYGVYRAGQRVATVREGQRRSGARWRSGVRTLVGGAPRTLRYTVHCAGAKPLEVDGDPAAVEYDLSRAGRHAATVGLRWLDRAATVATSVEVRDGEDPELIIALVAMIEGAWGRL
jgi:uncharacterized protein YxjI